uniref:Uncharacterized protein n=1 Tax=Kalanchoe fedtschenkoi TaxID=63787 RepID=A0A7N0SVZ2_KALFE
MLESEVPCFRSGEKVLDVNEAEKKNSLESCYLLWICYAAGRKKNYTMRSRIDCSMIEKCLAKKWGADCDIQAL